MFDESTDLMLYECEKDGTIVDDHEVYINGTVILQRIYEFTGNYYYSVRVDGKNTLFSRLDWLSKD